MVGIDFVWTVGFFFSNLLQCYPIKVNWTGIGNVVGYCVDTNLLLIYQSWSDVATNGEFPEGTLFVFPMLMTTQW